MSMMLWKTLALGGVIGAGSLVVIQAQRDLQLGTKTGDETLTQLKDEFPLLDAETGLQTTFPDSAEARDELGRFAEEPELQAPNSLAEVSTGPVDLASNSTSRSSARVQQASNEVADGFGNPFAAAPIQSEPGQSEPADESSAGVATFALDDGPVATESEEPANEAAQVTLDRPVPDDVALIDPARSSQAAPEGDAQDPFSALDSAPAPTANPAQAASGDDNPFAAFSRPDRSRTAEMPASEGSPFDAAPVPEAADPGGFPAPQPGMLATPKNTAPLSIPEVASQQDAGLAAPQAPRIPSVSPQVTPLQTAAVPEQASPVNDLPPITLLGADESPSSIPKSTTTAAGTEAETLPADVSSIPAGKQPALPAAPVNNEPAGDLFNTAPFPAESSIPSGAPAAAPVTNPATMPANQPDFGSFPPAQPAAQTPAQPPAQAPVSRTPDLNGTATIDRDVSSGPSQPQLTIVKHAPKEAIIGQDLEYSILVRNVGQSAAHNVIVEDMIPRGSRLLGTIPKADSHVQKKNILWKLGTLNGGQEKLLQVKISPTDVGEIGSIATVSFSAEVAARTVIVEPKAQLTVNGLQDALVGEQIPFTFTLTNTGPVDMKGVAIRTVLPAQGLTHPGGSDLTYDVGDLPRNESRKVTLSLTATQVGDVSFNSQIVLNHRELTPVTTNLRVMNSRLTVARSGPTKRFVGRIATYNNTVTNHTPQALTGLTIVETLPAGLEPTGQIQNARWDAASRTLTWTINQLGPRASVDLPVSVVPRTTGMLEGHLVATDSSNNRAELTTKLEAAGFSSLVIDGGHNGQPVAVGDQVSFRFTVKNRGTGPAEDVVAMFDLPDEVEFVTAQGPNSVRFERIGKAIIFEAIPVVGAEESLTFDVVVQARSVTNGDRRIRVSLNSKQLPAEKPLEQEQQLVIFADESGNNSPNPQVQPTAGSR